MTVDFVLLGAFCPCNFSQPLCAQNTPSSWCREEEGSVLGRSYEHRLGSDRSDFIAGCFGQLTQSL